jgi:hypothetical protein
MFHVLYIVNLMRERKKEGCEMRLELCHVRFLKPFEEYAFFSCVAALLWHEAVGEDVLGFWG